MRPNCPRYQDYCDLGLEEHAKEVKRGVMRGMDESTILDQTVLELEQAIAACTNESDRRLLEKQRSKVYGKWLASLPLADPKTSTKRGRRPDIHIRRRA